MQEDKGLYDIFISGIQNHEYYNKKHNRKTNNIILRELMYFFWIIYVMILSPFVKITDKKIYIIYADIHEKILKGNRNYENLVYVGRILRRPKFVNTHNSIFTVFRMTDRFKLFLKSIFWGVRNKIELANFAHAIDFYIIASFIKRLSLNEIVISGHFDRYATWISLICKKEKISLTIDQHGALEKVKLPHKIYVNTLVSFNKNEEEYFKKFIVDDGEECIFINKGFESNVKFCEFKKNDKYVIGIASQDLYTRETLRIIRYLNDKYYKKIHILIYPHPREEETIYNEIKKYNNIEIIADYRHSNIDMLLTFFSTLVYDYLQFQNVKIICYPPIDIDMSFFNHERVTVIKELEEIETYLC